MVCFGGYIFGHWDLPLPSVISPSLLRETCRHPEKLPTCHLATQLGLCGKVGGVLSSEMGLALLAA
jgi:hypothetical protein